METQIRENPLLYKLNPKHWIVLRSGLQTPRAYSWMGNLVFHSWNNLLFWEKGCSPGIEIRSIEQMDAIRSLFIKDTLRACETFFGKECCCSVSYKEMLGA